MPVANLQNELVGTFPNLPYLHSLQLINRAFSRVRDIRLWSWEIVTDAQLFAPALITAGTVTTTAFSNLVTVDPVAAAAINTAPSIPPIAGAVGVGCQIRVGIGSNISTASRGPAYNITAWDGVSTLTLDKPFGEGTLTATSYQIGKWFYAAPANPASNAPTPNPQFIRLLSLTNKATGYSITGRKLYYSQEQLNRFDPQRGATGDPYIVAFYGVNSLGQPIYELYPNPVAQTTYTVTYWSRWPELSATQDFPQVPYNLIGCVMDLARSFASQWALANVSTKPELQTTNWVAARDAYKQEHLESLRLCLKQDDEIMPQLPFVVSRYRDLPLGGQFLQSHDINAWIGAPY